MVLPAVKSETVSVESDVSIVVPVEDVLTESAMADKVDVADKVPSIEETMLPTSESGLTYMTIS